MKEIDDLVKTLMVAYIKNLRECVDKVRLPNDGKTELKNLLDGVTNLVETVNDTNFEELDPIFNEKMDRIMQLLQLANENEGN